MRRAVWLTAVVAMTGCLGPRPDLSTFYLLTATAAPGGTAVDAPLGLGPVSVSPYLDRSEVASRVTENQIDYADTDRWAEPLSESVTRTLRMNLFRLLSPPSVVDYPWFEEQVTYGIAVDVSRLDADAAGSVVTLEASWRITGPNVADQLEAGSTGISESVNGTGTDAVVAAMSRAIARLAGDLATAVRGVHGR